jgi:hypothetical protein
MARCSCVMRGLSVLVPGLRAQAPGVVGISKMTRHTQISTRQQDFTGGVFADDFNSPPPAAFVCAPACGTAASS